MKIIKTVRVSEEIPTEIVKVLKEKAIERAKIDPEFAILRWHEQLEMIYIGEYGELPDVEDWYIDTNNS